MEMAEKGSFPTMTENSSIFPKETHVSWLELILFVSALSWGVACSSTKGNVATEQLLMSDAIDRTVSDFDFSPLSGHKVFLDTAYIVPNRNPQQLINTDYVISSLRQQMMAAGCQLVTTKEEADIIAEARLGALGTDGQMVIYGVPENNFLSRAVAVLPNAPPVPSIPEIALAKKDHKSAAAKLAVFAYDRQTLEPVWQSGLVQSESTALDTWVLGVGPFRRGTVEDAAALAASRSRARRPQAGSLLQPDENPIVEYGSEWVYSREKEEESGSKNNSVSDVDQLVQKTSDELENGQVTTANTSPAQNTVPATAASSTQSVKSTTTSNSK